ncbi:MAG: hypothetical protein U9R69_08815, partial [Thermodesulfobacteriota bacterium]|nr:hypothetical protein [Thermodesulfobacteriota bacterium]
MFYLFILLLILPPLTYYGLDQQWTSGLLEAGIGVLLLLLVFAAFRNKRPVFAVPGLLPLGCYCFLILLQLIPIPPFLLSILSPAAFEHYQETVWLFEPELWMPVTIRPEATLAHFLRFFSYTLFFVTTIQILRTSERLKKTVIILSFFGGIYAFFGLLQFFVPGARIFWVLSLWPEYLSHA